MGYQADLYAFVQPRIEPVLAEDVGGVRVVEGGGLFLQVRPERGGEVVGAHVLDEKKALEICLLRLLCTRYISSGTELEFVD